MGRTSIPVDSATKERLDRLKRDDETWDEFLERVTGRRGRPGEGVHQRIPGKLAMTFLDSSTIIEYLRGNRTVIDYLDERQPWWTSTVCVFEVLNGPAGTLNFDPVEERQRFGGVQALEFNEQLALEASRLQDEAIEDGSELSHRDAMIAATARSTGDEYVVADSDFETDPLDDVMNVTNLHGEE